MATTTIINHTTVSDLDDYVRAVAGDDTDYTGRWSRVNWAAAFLTYQAFTDAPWPQRPSLGPVPCLPEWLRALLDGRARPDTDTPAPTLCRIDADPRDWFRIVSEHPDDLQVWACNPVTGHQVTTPQIRAARDAAVTAGATPLLTITIEPFIESEDIRFVVNLEAFYTVDQNPTAPGAAAATAVLGWNGAPAPYHFRNQGDVLSEAELTTGRVASWEWL